MVACFWAAIRLFPRGHSGVPAAGSGASPTLLLSHLHDCDVTAVRWGAARRLAPESL
jgi:hypothetical protein